VSNSLFAFEGFLISDIDDISRPDVSHEELFFSERLCTLLFFNKCFDVLSWCHFLVHWWNNQWEHNIGIIPRCLAGLSGFMIEFLARNPILVEGSFVKNRAPGLVSDDDVIAQL
jgi:hypothetical protein